MFSKRRTTGRHTAPPPHRYNSSSPQHEATVASKQAAKLRKRGNSWEARDSGEARRALESFAEVGGAVASAVKSAEPAVRSGVESAKDLSHDVAVAGKKFGKQARKQATPVLKSGAESARASSAMRSPSGAGSWEARASKRHPC